MAISGLKKLHLSAMTMAGAVLKKANTDQRSGKALVHAVEHKRPPNEVREVFVKLQEV